MFGLLALALVPPILAQTAQTVKITANKGSYSPNEIVLKKGVPVVLQLTSGDRAHGFNVPAWKVRADIKPGETAEVKVTPPAVGEFSFYCDVFCGSGHEDMYGTFKVVD